VACQPTESTPDGTAAGPKRVSLGIEALFADSTLSWANKRVGVVLHAASRLPDSTHVLDALLAHGVQVTQIFALEHGFRSDHGAGEAVANTRDPASGLPVVSLYGNHKKPTQQDVADLDLIIWDIQDVGTRFYTYLSSLVYVMEACARHDLPLWICDRPNPNGWYTAGPILEPQHRSFVGLHPIPIVHGLTMGEYARLVNYSGWLPDGLTAPVRILACEGYTHNMRWEATGLPWFPPSPNLPTVLSAELYPALCWFEGTNVSVGRGTKAPFEQVGAPYHNAYQAQWMRDTSAGTPTRSFSSAGVPALATRFVPVPLAGVAPHPKHQGLACYGVQFQKLPADVPNPLAMGVRQLVNFHHEYAEYRKLAARNGTPLYGDFFSPFFEKLVGTQTLRQAIVAGQAPERIVAQWDEGVSAFQRTTAPHKIYPSE